MNTTLTSYVLNSQSEGDYSITFTFSDNTESTQTIHFGILVDVAGGKTAQEQLTDLVGSYANAYLSGLATEASPSSEINTGDTQEVSSDATINNSHA